ncbi:galactose mutarotase [Ruminococcaceae bacterium OttesenSCG-928-A11]|nr:galactose mutarotase [Ruminococcaceae bacterium OttesenSCG-928-A11]
MEQAHYGRTAAGQDVDSFTLRNAGGVEMRCISYGGRITHLLLPGQDGPCDILLGYDTLAEYEADQMQQGAFVGRYAGLIDGAAFELDGQTVHLAKNHGAHHLHGNLSHTVFTPQVMGESSVSFTATSPAGDEGFPGALQVTVTYTLTDENELVMDFRATTTADTHLNLTQHSYFNLAGPGGDAMASLLHLNADRFLEARDALLPTGRILPVAGGAFDFTTEKPIGQDIQKDDPQLVLAGGYDHSFVINRMRPGQLALAAIARHPQSGRVLRLYTSQPAVHLYTGNGLSGEAGKDGVPMPPHGGFCLEYQHYADSPNHPEFPSTLLAAGEKYHEIAVWQFEF